MARRRRTRSSKSATVATVNSTLGGQGVRDTQHAANQASGGGGRSSSPPITINAETGSATTPPSSQPNVTTVRSGNQEPRVTTINQQPVRSAVQPTITEYLESPSRYVTGTDALRARYLGASPDTPGSAAAERGMSAVEAALALAELDASPGQIRQRLEKATASDVLDRSYKGDDSTALSEEEIAAAFEAAGLPGLTFARGVTPGESGGRPGAVGDDAAAGYGNTFGYGLAQITPLVQGDETLAKFAVIAGLAPDEASVTPEDIETMKGPHESYFVPNKNAQMAAVLYSPGNVGSTWYGYDSSVPDGLHYEGPMPSNGKGPGKGLISDAITALGKKETESILTGGTAAPSTEPRELPGVYAGSRRVLKGLIGDYAQTEDWRDKEEGHASGGMHDPSNEAAFAGDMSVDEGLVDTIAKNLGLDPDEVDYGTTGLESTPIPGKPGYVAQFMPYTHGSGPHVHLGVEYTGEEAPPGTMMGAPSTGSTTALPGGMAGNPGSTIMQGLTGSTSTQKAPAAAPSRGFSPNPLAARASLPSSSSTQRGLDEAAETESDPLTDEVAPEDVYASLYTPKRRLRTR